MARIKTAFFLLSAFLCLCSAARPEVRMPVVSGQFYPADSAALAEMIAAHLAQVKPGPAIDGELIALIVPHAGLVYSGKIAANSYKLLKGSDVQSIVLCGPSHRQLFDGISVYGPSVSWKTPLGTVPCDSALCRRLIDQNRLIRFSSEGHAMEHSLEVQLPYIQTVLPDAAIVPVVMGNQRPETVDITASALANVTEHSNSILIASSDWQHYRPASVGWKMDSLGMECLKDLDPDRLQRLLAQGQVEACGGGPITAVLKAAIARGANRAMILRYGDSGDFDGHKDRVVGYIAAAIYKSKEGGDMSSESPAGDGSSSREAEGQSYLTEQERRELLSIARQSIAHFLTHRELPSLEASGVLADPGAAFVTLQKGGRLRGCIGYTAAVKPLYQTVAECAVQAAMNDPRFPPLKPDELDAIHIEISVLTPLRKVDSLQEIKVGRDGLMISLGRNRGLLLPQVATEYGWSRDEFLENTCLKAGLAPDSYKSPDALIQSFQALIFEE
jgi:AmmeMemoRadiSam system protein B/AmmeMemoRadiSam system protein A